MVLSYRFIVMDTITHTYLMCMGAIIVFLPANPNHEGSVVCVALHQSDCRRGLICFVLCSGQYCPVFGGLIVKITSKIAMRKSCVFTLNTFFLKHMRQHHMHVTI